MPESKDGRRIMVVAEDILANRLLLRKIFSADFDIEEAADGEAALALLRLLPHVDILLLDLVMPKLNGFKVLSAMRADPQLSDIPVIVATGNDDESAQIDAFDLGAADVFFKPYNVRLLRSRVYNVLKNTENASLKLRIAHQNELLRIAQRDALTGLYNRDAFCERAAAMIRGKPAGFYCVSCFDIDGFKVVNDQYGLPTGDLVLRIIAEFLGNFLDSTEDCAACRTGTDNFALIFPVDADVQLTALESFINDRLAQEGIHLTLQFSAGRCVVDSPELSVSAILDRALLARRTVKGRFDERTAYFNEEMRRSMLTERLIIGRMESALKNGEFVPWLQPQYNHATGELCGAEALARWERPGEPPVSPAEFIPVFEKNGFIYELDKCIWESVCRLLRRWLDAGREVVSVSVNVSRHDIFCPDFFEVITGLVERFDIPERLLRLEVTESAFTHGTEQLIDMVKRLRSYGFTVEIDDFGSGYSSLNTLKDVPADVLKIDMRFLEGSERSQRGGTILESIVRMARWLKLSVIAEGVETKAQADYLQSIGCRFVQGYLYSRPLPVPRFEKLMLSTPKGGRSSRVKTVAGLDSGSFWNPESLDTLIFSSFVGGACVIEHHDGRFETVRVNRSYLELLRTNLSVTELLSTDMAETLSESDALLLRSELARVKREGGTFQVELHMLLTRDTPVHSEWISFTGRVIAESADRDTVYMLAQNITERKAAQERQRQAEERLSLMIQDMPGGYAQMRIEADGSLTPVYLNGEFCRMSQMNYERIMELCAGNAFGVVHPEDVGPVSARINDGVANGATVSTRVRLLRGDGSYLPVQAFYRVTEGEYGERYLNGYYTDISKQLESEARQTELMDNLPCGAAIYEVKDSVISVGYVNKRFRQLVSRDMDDIRTKDSITAVHPDDRAGVMAALWDATTGRDTLEHTARLLSGKGGYTPFRIIGHAVRRAPGEATVYVTYFPVDEDSRLARQMLTEAVQNIRSGIAIYEVRDGMLVPAFSSNRACAMFGYTHGEYEALLSEGRGIEQIETVLKLLPPLCMTEDGNAYETVLRARRRDESEFWLRINTATRRYTDGKLLLYSTLTDVTQSMEAELQGKLQAERYRLLADMLEPIMNDYDVEKDVLTVIEYRADGSTEEHIVPNYLKNIGSTGIIRKNNLKGYKELFSELLATPHRDTRVYRADFGRGERWYRAHYSSLSDADGRVCRVLSMSEDIHQEQLTHLKLLKKAEIDPVTGLYNRVSGDELLRLQLIPEKRSGADALFMIDVDDFKSINDRYGHQEGDAALRAFASVLRSSFRTGDIVCRYGGDEFVACMSGCGSTETAMDKAVRINRAIAGLSLDSGASLRCSIGVVMAPKDDSDVDTLLAQADYALYVSKHAGKNSSTLFDPETMSGKVSDLGTWRER